MSPVKPTQLLLAWTLPTVAIILSYLWYKKKRLGQQSDPGDKAEAVEFTVPGERCGTPAERRASTAEKRTSRGGDSPARTIRTFSRSLSGVETAPIDIVIPPELKSSKSQPIVVTDEDLDMHIKRAAPSIKSSYSRTTPSKLNGLQRVAKPRSSSQSDSKTSSENEAGSSFENKIEVSRGRTGDLSSSSESERDSTCEINNKHSDTLINMTLPEEKSVSESEAVEAALTEENMTDRITIITTDEADSAISNQTDDVVTNGDLNPEIPVEEITKLVNDASLEDNGITMNGRNEISEEEDSSSLSSIENVTSDVKIEIDKVASEPAVLSPISPPQNENIPINNTEEVIKTSKIGSPTRKPRTISCSNIENIPNNNVPEETVKSSNKVDSAAEAASVKPKRVKTKKTFRRVEDTSEFIQTSYIRPNLKSDYNSGKRNSKSRLKSRQNGRFEDRNPGKPNGYHNRVYDSNSTLNGIRSSTSPDEVILGSHSLSSISNHSEDSGKGGSEGVSPSPITLPRDDGSDSVIFIEFFVPSELAGLLIGKRGVFVKRIKNETNVNMVIRHTTFQDDYRICTIEGPQSKVWHALQIIRKKFPIEDYPDFTFEPYHEQLCLTNLYTRLVMGITNDTVLGYAETAAHLFLFQPYHPAYIHLQTLVKSMNDCYAMEGAPMLGDDVPENTLCAAYWCGDWLRARILERKGDNFIVRLMDCGVRAEMCNEDLRQLRCCFITSIPFQSIECHLSCISPVGGPDAEWSEEAKNFVLSIAHNTMIHTQVDSYLEDGVTPLVSCYVTLCGTNNVVFLNKELVDRGYAIWTAPIDPHEHAANSVALAQASHLAKETYCLHGDPRRRFMMEQSRFLEKSEGDRGSFENSSSEAEVCADEVRVPLYENDAGSLKCDGTDWQSHVSEFYMPKFYYPPMMVAVVTKFQPVDYEFC